ncbi:hypothetical protein LX81_00285 [Palleronia aestuarii]|uniref:Uncharacterized protein n=1 Tax=Palleronia aestuarii TaxID=568105 RepID=A0A2W7P8Y1_9RHOB|nr:hypothetical protein [Palleronia aestuarii]PZX19822.1 hypothetical protein LX81_00285 [Palleronia aestuarii]
MALAFPREMVSAWCWTNAEFKLVHRQEVSRTAADTQVRDLGPALWHASFESDPLPKTKADELEADFETLGGALRTFFAVPMLRKDPARWTGEGMAGCSVNAIRSDRRAIRIAGLPAGFELSAGDFVSILTSVPGRELLKIAVGGTASSTGLSPWLEVTDAIRVSVKVEDFAKLHLPFVEMRLVPGSLEKPRDSVVRWRVKFDATQVVR